MKTTVNRTVSTTVTKTPVSKTEEGQATVAVEPSVDPGPKIEPAPAPENVATPPDEEETPVVEAAVAEEEPVNTEEPIDTEEAPVDTEEATVAEDKQPIIEDKGQPVKDTSEAAPPIPDVEETNVVTTSTETVDTQPAEPVETALPDTTEAQAVVSDDLPVIHWSSCYPAAHPPSLLLQTSWEILQKPTQLSVHS